MDRLDLLGWIDRTNRFGRNGVAVPGGQHPAKRAGGWLLERGFSTGWTSMGWITTILFHSVVSSTECAKVVVGGRSVGERHSVIEV